MTNPQPLSLKVIY